MDDTNHPKFYMRKKSFTALGTALMLLLAASGLSACGFSRITPIDDPITVEASSSAYEVDPLSLFSELPNKATAGDFTVEGQVDSEVPGDYPITVTYRKKAYDFTVRVLDTTAPVFAGADRVFMSNDAEALKEEILKEAPAFASDVTELTIRAGDFIRISDYVPRDQLESDAASDSNEAFSPLTIPDADGQDSDPEELTSGIYVLELVYTDLGKNTVSGQVEAALDLDAPVLMDGDGNPAELEDQTLEVEDPTLEPEYDLSSYTWTDNEEVVDSSDQIECVDEENHIWQVTATATDVNGNTAELSYQITLKEVEPQQDEAGSGGSSSGGGNSGDGSGCDGDCGSGGYSGEAGFITSYAEEVLALVNEQRAAYGLWPLTMNYTLVACSDIRAQEIESYFAHIRPDGSECFSAFNVCYWYAGENIAEGYTTPAAVMDGWMNSEGHRANILSENFSEIAISCYYDPNGYYKYYWVQNFIG